MADDTTIPFTQFLRPHGRRRAVKIEVPIEQAKEAKSLIDRGYRFEIEELTHGLISMTVERGDGDDGPVAQKICVNGPPVMKALGDLILDAAHFVAARNG